MICVIFVDDEKFSTTAKCDHISRNTGIKEIIHGRKYILSNLLFYFERKGFRMDLNVFNLDVFDQGHALEIFMTTRMQIFKEY